MKKIFLLTTFVALLAFLVFPILQKPKPSVQTIELSSTAMWPLSFFQRHDFKKAPAAKLENGGTVFSIANFGSFLDPQSKFYNGWDKYGWDPDFYSIVRGYHIYKALVDRTIKSIKDSGQSKTGLLLWFVDNRSEQESQGHFITTNNSKLYPQHKKNLQDYVKHVDELGFNEIQIRFGSQGGADVFGTSAEQMGAQIEHHWSLIQDVHDSISEMKLKINVMYDLGGELAAHSYTCRPEVTRFLTEIWKRYTKKYGAQDTLGFSWNHFDSCGGRRILEIYQSVGVFPKINGLDIYGNPGEAYSILRKISALLEEKNLKNKMSFFIQETWYNDVDFASEVNQAVQDFGIDIKYIMQWPLKRGSKTIHFSEKVPLHFDAYRR